MAMSAHCWNARLLMQRRKHQIRNENEWLEETLWPDSSPLELVLKWLQICVHSTNPIKSHANLPRNTWMSNSWKTFQRSTSGVFNSWMVCSLGSHLRVRRLGWEVGVSFCPFFLLHKWLRHPSWHRYHPSLRYTISKWEMKKWQRGDETASEKNVEKQRAT